MLAVSVIKILCVEAGEIYNRSIAGCIIDDFRTCVFYLLLIIATILDRFREKGGGGGGGGER